MIRNFYARTAANVPWIREELDIVWIFDACIEALGEEAGVQFLEQLQKDVEQSKLLYHDQKDFLKKLRNYIETRNQEYYIPLPLSNAIERYNHWETLNPMATQTAREQTVIEVYHLYRIDRYPEIARYFLYRYTYFMKTGQDAASLFDRLISTLWSQRNKPAIQLLELSDLQAALVDKTDRNIFSRMVFPQVQARQELEILKFGESESEQVIVHTTILDKYGIAYTIRPPVAPAEIGQLYRLFFNQNYPKEISENESHFVVLDAQERVVAGISYQMEDNVVEIEGTVVNTPLKERGIGTAIIEDFCNRMASQNIRVIKAHFFLQPFYEKLGFRVDKSWGALVKFIVKEEETEPRIEDDIKSTIN